MAERIKEHPILGVQEKGAPVKFTFDGKEMEGMEGEPIAAALKAAGVMVHRYTKKEHKPRGIFCAIGRCTDCVMDCGWSAERANLYHTVKGRNGYQNAVWCQ